MVEVDGIAKEAVLEVSKDEVGIEEAQEPAGYLEIVEPAEPKEEETVLPENNKHREQGETLFIGSRLIRFRTTEVRSFASLILNI